MTQRKFAGREFRPLCYSYKVFMGFPTTRLKTLEKNISSRRFKYSIVWCRRSRNGWAIVNSETLRMARFTQGLGAPHRSHIAGLFKDLDSRGMLDDAPVE